MYILEALRYYGQEGPIAIVRLDGRIMAYTPQGIDSLLIKYKSHRYYPSLRYIKQEMSKPGDYKDIQGNDFSGQEELFS